MCRASGSLTSCFLITGHIYVEIIALTRFQGKVVHVLHQSPEGAPVFTPGTEMVNEFEELAPKAGETVIWKKFPGSFAETELQKDLGDHKKVVLTGYMVGLPVVHKLSCFRFSSRAIGAN